ncbi:ATP-NAD kinase-like domain-containing protein [Lophiotrema nucula]|uniref:ATP-NAD kinase-like domain-containing protein n=1 Tax=Lophiotrema nucula TaxID=690887 RepID=A0A6A5YXQ7_9PLEO|nr:ATP-NAD kinase-like domain-containing protein [Lophiotrema nucula]
MSQDNLSPGNPLVPTITQAIEMSSDYFDSKTSTLATPYESDQVDNDRHSISSDPDGQLEVVFENEGIRRRKSSLVPSSAPVPSRPKTARQKTQCFVHTLLQKHDGLPMKPEEASYEGLAQERLMDKDPHGHVHDSHHSRLLTKKQISDMAFGIRELSKKLSQIRLKLNVRNIFLLGKAHDESLIAHSRETTEWLLTRDGHYRVYVENTLEHNKIFNAEGLLAKNPSFKGRLKFWDNDLCAQKPQTFDIVLALGGDGTVLYASWLFQRVVPPVLAFSLGSLGFLTKFDYELYPQTLSRAFDEGITVSLRLRFEATIMRSQAEEGGNNKSGSRDLVEELIGEESEDHHTHRPDGTHNILNEVVVDRGPNATMSSIELFGDDEHFTTVQADGICVSTPTGSTAYNLAAGGSLCHPDNPVILVTAICAHTLSFRPIILPDTVVLRAGVPYDARTSSWASFDGKERVELRPGDYVTISASRFPFPSVLPLDRKSKDWIDSISRTLQWNSRQRQKSFKEWSA